MLPAAALLGLAQGGPVPTVPTVALLSVVGLMAVGGLTALAASGDAESGVPELAQVGWNLLGVSVLAGTLIGVDVLVHGFAG